MSTVTPVQLVAPASLSTADTAVYTVPSFTTAKIGRAVFSNSSTSASTITAGITTGVGLTGPTTLVPTLALAGGATYVSPELAGAVIPAGSQLHAYQGTTGAVTFTVSGLTIV